MSTPDEECTTCGSSLADRVRYAKGDASIPLNFKDCPHCGSPKCCMCDMGDDVSCMNCEDDE
jgi:hypothetical protein